MQDTINSTISNSLQLFQNTDWKIRVVMRDGDPWFVASDVCKCLELKDDAGTICRELDEQDKVTLSREEFMGRDSNRGIICSVDARVQSLVFVSESGMYDLVMMSRKPEAKAFKRWVTHDVIPSIRKTGGYSVAQTAVPSYMLESEEERAIAWAEEHRQARLALEAKEREIKSLQAQKDVMRQEYKSNKDFCNELIAKGIAVQKNGKPYALSTLRSRMSPILQEVSHTYRYSISEETVVVDGVERKTPYYHRDVCDMIAAVVTPQWLAKPTSDSITPLV